MIRDPVYLQDEQLWMVRTTVHGIIQARPFSELLALAARRTTDYTCARRAAAAPVVEQLWFEPRYHTRPFSEQHLHNSGGLQCAREARHGTVLELISETASNLRTLIFGEFPNLHCENAPC